MVVMVMVVMVVMMVAEAMVVMVLIAMVVMVLVAMVVMVMMLVDLHSFVFVVNVVCLARKELLVGLGVVG